MYIVHLCKDCVIIKLIKKPLQIHYKPIVQLIIEVINIYFKPILKYITKPYKNNFEYVEMKIISLDNMVVIYYKISL
jgi:hypothetical protein